MTDIKEEKEEESALKLIRKQKWLPGPLLHHLYHPIQDFENCNCLPIFYDTLLYLFDARRVLVQLIYYKIIRI